jgi:branched-chain amino acid transport system permease protein
VFGFAMVLIMIWRPRGLVATREPTVYLGKPRAVPAAPVLQAEARAGR